MENKIIKKRRPMSEETKRKIGDKHRGKSRVISEETKRKMSMAARGRKRSRESAKKQSESLKAKYRNGYVSPSLGKKKSEKTKQLLSEAQKGRHNSPRTEFKKGRISEKGMLGKKHTEEWKKNASERRKNEKHYNWKGGISKEKDYGKIQKALRRKRVREMGGKFTVREWENKKKMYGYRCVFCGVEEKELLNNSKIGLTVDHIIPITKWKEYIKENPLEYKCNDIQNIQPLCMRCNVRKRNKIIVGRSVKND